MVEVTIKVANKYRHAATGKVFEIEDMWIDRNPIEGRVDLKIRLHVCDDDQYTAVIGQTVLERWWPHLTLVYDASAPDDFPWCETCEGYHRFDPTVTCRNANGELPD